MTTLSGVLSRGALSCVVQKVFPSSGATIAMMVAGDSIANALAEPNAGGGIAEEFISYLADRNITATIADGAQGGQGLYDFIDETTKGKGSKYLTLWDVLPNKGEITDIHFTIGANDAVEFAQGIYLKASYKADFSALIDLVFSDFPSLERFYIRPIGRYVNDGSINYPTALQDIRELQNELVTEKANVYLLPPYYDEPQVDTVHPTLATYDLLARRDADRIANVLGLRSQLGRGMTIASAEVSNLGIDVTVNFDSGNDITVPSTSGEGLDFFRLDDGTNFQRIDRVDNNTFRLYAGAPYTGTPTLQTAYGQMFDLGLVPETVQENGTHTLPLVQETKTVTNTIDDTDPILRLTDLKYYSNVGTFARNTTTGNNFDAMSSINNTEFEPYDVGGTGIDMTYDATAFGGAGGFRPSANGGYMRGKGQLLNSTVGWFGGFVVEFDNTAFDADRTLFSLGRDAGILNNARLYTRTGLDALWLTRADDLGTPSIQSNVLGNRFAIMVNIISGGADGGEVYINDGTTPVLTFDPRADWLLIGTDCIYIGGNTTSAFNIPFVKERPHNATNDPSIATIMNDMKSKYNIT